MITAIRIKGFKSLLDTYVEFGPITCIAGANAAGKSNLFDAIVFLSNLADKSIIEAVKSVRNEAQKNASFKDIFFKFGDEQVSEIEFEVDMIIPLEGEDDLGQKAEATITSLRYCLNLEFFQSETNEEIRIKREELLPITQTDAKKSIKFQHSKEWINSCIKGRRSTSSPFISTKESKINIHQDDRKGRNAEYIASRMPRTLLSTVTAEYPTAFLARLEMRNWMMLQFEPTALRASDEIYKAKNAKITAKGENMAATLYRLHLEKKGYDLYQTLANRVKELVEGVSDLTIDKDDKRDLLTLQLSFTEKIILPAQSLSDGTLRFLCLAILEQDTHSTGLLCLEEPENGINPKKIEAMLRLLQGIAMDTEMEISEDNPLRQVIVNTHSPLVVGAMNAQEVIFAESKEDYSTELNKKVKQTQFAIMADTWRHGNFVSMKEIIDYLGGDYSSPIIENSSLTSIPAIKSLKKIKELANEYQLALGF